MSLARSTPIVTSFQRMGDVMHLMPLLYVTIHIELSLSHMTASQSCQHACYFHVFSSSNQTLSQLCSFFILLLTNISSFKPSFATVFLVHFLISLLATISSFSLPLFVLFLHTPPLIIFLYLLLPHPFTYLSFPSSILLYPPVRYSSSCHKALKFFTAANIKIACSLLGHGAEQSHRSRLTFQRCVIKKNKVKLSDATRHAGAKGERMYISYSFLTSALDGRERSASRSGRALPSGKDPRYPCTGGWVNLRACVDTEARGKIFCLCLGSKPGRPEVRTAITFALVMEVVRTSETSIHFYDTTRRHISEGCTLFLFQ
jgi:hypothetical protein